MMATSVLLAAVLLGHPLVPTTTTPKVHASDLLSFLAQAFLRGGVGGFLAIKAASTAGKALIAGGAASSASSTSARHKESTRIGLAHAYVAVSEELGTAWL